MAICEVKRSTANSALELKAGLKATTEVLSSANTEAARGQLSSSTDF